MDILTARDSDQPGSRRALSQLRKKLPRPVQWRVPCLARVPHRTWPDRNCVGPVCTSPSRKLVRDLFAAVETYSSFRKNIRRLHRHYLESWLSRFGHFVGRKPESGTGPETSDWMAARSCDCSSVAGWELRSGSTSSIDRWIHTNSDELNARPPYIRDRDAPAAEARRRTDSGYSAYRRLKRICRAGG